jgi:hypothetical protein
MRGMTVAAGRLGRAAEVTFGLVSPEPSAPPPAFWHGTSMTPVPGEAPHRAASPARTLTN